MGRRPHKMLGIAAGLAYAGLMHLHGWWFVGALIGGWFGGTAPDDLEIAKAVYTPSGWRRSSLIPHRTITHWVLPWAFLLWCVVVAVFSEPADSVLRNPLFVTFVLGGVTHLVADVFNPTGIPLWKPTAAGRVSLRKWKSGCDGEAASAFVILTSVVFLWLL